MIAPLQNILEMGLYRFNEKVTLNFEISSLSACLPDDVCGYKNRILQFRYSQLISGIKNSGKNFLTPSFQILNELSVLFVIGPHKRSTQILTLCVVSLY